MKGRLKTSSSGPCFCFFHVTIDIAKASLRSISDLETAVSWYNIGACALACSRLRDSERKRVRKRVGAGERRGGDSFSLHLPFSPDPVRLIFAFPFKFSCCPYYARAWKRPRPQNRRIFPGAVSLCSKE